MQIADWLADARRRRTCTRAAPTTSASGAAKRVSHGGRRARPARVLRRRVRARHRRRLGAAAERPRAAGTRAPTPATPTCSSSSTRPRPRSARGSAARAGCSATGSCRTARRCRSARAARSGACSGSLAERGLELRAAVELECYLVPAEGALHERAYPYHGLRTAADRELVDAIVAPLEGSGLRVEAANFENGIGQLELNVAYRDALGAADDAFLAKQAIRVAAAGRRACARRSWRGRSPASRAARRTCTCRCGAAASRPSHADHAPRAGRPVRDAARGRRAVPAVREQLRAPAAALAGRHDAHVGAGEPHGRAAHRRARRSHRADRAPPARRRLQPLRRARRAGRPGSWSASTTGAEPPPPTLGNCDELRASSCCRGRRPRRSRRCAPTAA